MALKDDWVAKDTPGKTEADWTFTHTAQNAVATQVNANTTQVDANTVFLNATQYGVVGNGTADDTVALQAWLDDVVATHAQGWLPNGTYKITTTLVVPSGWGWTIHGENVEDTIISQATANTPVLQIGNTGPAGVTWTASRTYTVENVTLTYATPQPSTNTNAYNLVFSGDSNDNSSTYFAQFRNVGFLNGYYGMKTIAGLYPPWGCGFDQMNMERMSGGFLDHTGCMSAPGNRWGRMTLWCSDSVGPIFKQWGDTSTFVASIEFLQAHQGATLVDTTAGFHADIGAMKLENGTYTGTGKPLFDFASTHFVRLGHLHIFGNDMTFGDGYSAIRFGWGTTDDRSLLEISSLRLEATTLTGDCYGLQSGDTPGRAVIGTVVLDNGWQLCDNVNLLVAEHLSITSWVNGSVVAVGDESYVVTPGSANIIRFSTALTGAHSVTLPDPYGNDVFAGLWYEIIADGSHANGWGLIVAQANHGNIFAFPVDHTKVRFTYSRANYEWVLTDVSALGAAQTGWAPTNVSADRVFDANATTLDEVADVLGTLIADLKVKGIISA